MDADIIALTAMTPQAPRAYQIADEFRRRGKTVVMGGFHASNLPDEALAHVDAVVVGEGELSWPQLLDDFSRGTLQRLYHSRTPVGMDRYSGGPSRDLRGQALSADQYHPDHPRLSL